MKSTRQGVIRDMKPILVALISFVSCLFRSRNAMQIEIAILRHQVAVLQRSVKRPRVTPADRILWCWVSRLLPDWRNSLLIVQPATVLAWRRRKFREHWIKLGQACRPGRPPVSKEIQDLIREMSRANPLWGSPRIMGELRKVGINVAKSTVEKYMVRHRKPPAQTWRRFLKNHVGDLVSIDFFIVPTVKFKLLFVLILLAHKRRRVVHFNVTEYPSEDWTARQVLEAFPWDEAPRYVLRDRDWIYGSFFRGRVQNMGIKEVVIAPRSPWQTPYVERVIGSIRRECLDHVLVLGERHLKSTLTRYFHYYHAFRTHRSLDMDCPVSREVQLPHRGKIVTFPEVGGLHHHYERIAA